MELEELLAQLKDLCAGKTAEEIEQELTESSFAERIPDTAVFAKYLVSLASEPDDDAVASPDDEPAADVDID